MVSSFTALMVFSAAWAYYGAAIFSASPIPGGAEKFWGKEPSLFEKWSFDFVGFSIFVWVAFPAGCLTMICKDQPTVLARLSYFAASIGAMCMVSLNHSRSHSAGGIIVDQEHLIGIAVQVILSMLLGAALRNQTEFAAGASPFENITFVPKLVTLVHFVMCMFYMVDMSSLNTMARYCIGYTELKTANSEDANRWFIDVIIMHSLLVWFVVSYGTPSVQKGFNCILMCQRAAEFWLFNYHLKDELAEAGTGFAPEFMQEANMLRGAFLVMHVVAIFWPKPAADTKSKKN